MAVELDPLRAQIVPHMAMARYIEKNSEPLLNFYNRHEPVFVGLAEIACNEGIPTYNGSVVEPSRIPDLFIDKVALYARGEAELMTKLTSLLLRPDFSQLADRVEDVLKGFAVIALNTVANSRRVDA